MEFKLILKKINEELNEEEKAIFNKWYNESEEHRLFFKRVQENRLKGKSIIDIKSGWDAISTKINPKRKSKGNFKIAAAIAAILVVGSILFVLDNRPNNPKVNITPMLDQNSILAGTDRAILTLEDGSNVVLEKGKEYKTPNIFSNGSQLVYKNASDAKIGTTIYNILTIPRGGQFYIVLADGTQVWLNSDSKLKYPKTFKENAPRQVELIYGEAYFDVTPSSEHKGSEFIVEHREQRINVLGTEFNIKAYQEEEIIATTLVEGKVALENGITSNHLLPGQQAILNIENKQISINPVDVYNEVSWKTGFFSFKNKSLEDITKVLSRWYDIEVIFAREDIKQITFTGVFKKVQDINEILKSIESTNEVTYIINQKTITMK